MRPILNLVGGFSWARAATVIFCAVTTTTITLRAQTFNTRFSFDSPGTRDFQLVLAEDSDEILFGTANDDGGVVHCPSDGCGAAFKATTTEILRSLYSFDAASDGGQPGTVVQAPKGWKWLTVVANLDGGYRRTQFYDPHYDTWVGQWDSRIELWFPPGPNRFSWGLYGRVAAIIGSEPNAWQNGALAWPGVGLQMYPFSRLRDQRARFLLGPIRIFGEYNFTHYWGEDFHLQGTSWRPKNQVRAGFEYWKAVNVNATTKPGWLETYDAAFFQSANEFTNRESTPIVANSLRVGIRWPGRSIAFDLIPSPYAAVESSWDKYERKGQCFLSSPDSRNPQNPCDFFWENRFLAGGGLRITPRLGDQTWLTRLVIYGEYLKATNYYGPEPPLGTPRFDIRIGLSASLKSWYN
jgi:hypothetical protein